LRTPTSDELRRFCRVDNWIDLTAEPGHKRSDHDRYAKVLASGETLYTRVSRGSGGIDDHNLFKHILREQLRVTKAQFWAAVDRGTLPTRPGQEEKPAPAGETLDYSLVRQLIRAGYAQDQIARFSKQDAVDRLNHFRTYGRQLEGSNREVNDQRREA
jgi:hypothetical protein